MKRVFTLFLLLISGFLFSYQGQSPNPGFLFQIDGGRRVSPIVNTQNRQELAIGFLTVTSTDNEGALNSSADQQNVNALLQQVNQLYVQIFNQCGSGSKSAPTPTYAPAKRSPPISGCEHRRSSKWRSS
ncbi:MAG: hypothetical protein S4CHLAM6_00530 [Chlamydiae bacterium]|nr:hypothetical protein [Chlamydiota bacterium]